MPAQKFTTLDVYFAATAPQARTRLEIIAREVAGLFPDALPCISYNIPAFKVERVFFFFAAFKNHIGIYPPVRRDVALIERLKPYRNEKGNLAFPLKEPLPLDLILEVARALYVENAKA